MYKTVKKRYIVIDCPMTLFLYCGKFPSGREIIFSSIKTSFQLPNPLDLYSYGRIRTDLFETIEIIDSISVGRSVNFYTKESPSLFRSSFIFNRVLIPGHFEQHGKVYANRGEGIDDFTRARFIQELSR